jgi:hypothetical protein
MGGVLRTMGANYSSEEKQRFILNRIFLYTTILKEKNKDKKTCTNILSQSVKKTRPERPVPAQNKTRSRGKTAQADTEAKKPEALSHKNHI